MLVLAEEDHSEILCCLHSLWKLGDVMHGTVHQVHGPVLPVHGPVLPVHGPVHQVHGPVLPVHGPVLPVHGPVLPVSGETGKEPMAKQPFWRPGGPSADH